ncbi:hypothetical protein [Pectobacterium versatile]|uniref:hypothetical protein n=1 Tax=Pectobacterium versatile TaxID=2488639 RepID=UPI0038205FAB
MDIELLKIKVDIWKQVINTQQHFNDLGMKIRNFAILILSAFIGAIGVSFKSGYSMPIFGYPTSVSTILSIGAALIWLLFFFVDVYWYHPLLVGAVKKGIDIEKNIGDELKDVIDLTHAVGKESPIKIGFFELHSKHKANVFYIGVFIMLISSAMILAFVDTSEKKDKPEVFNRFDSLVLTCKRTLNYDGVECVLK